VRANVHPYYANVFPGGQAPPAYQAANYLQQTGTLVVSADAALTIFTASPGEFQAPQVQPDRLLQLVLAGDPGATYSVQSSTNLVDWQPFMNVTLINGTFTLNAGWVTNADALYFRARNGP
jgi:hypothetical protein